MNESNLVRSERDDPWTDLDRMFDNLRVRVFGTIGAPPVPVFFPWADGERVPSVLRNAPTDVTDTGKGYKISAEIPGIPKDRLDIRIRGSSVEIRAEHENQTEKKGDEFVRRERSFQGFYRSVELPEPVVATEAKARLENGVLEIELPKQTPTPSPEEVKVSVN